MKKIDRRRWLILTICGASMLAFAFIFSEPSEALAQWVSNSTNNINNTNSGNVGIGSGNTNPLTRLSITPTTTEPKITLWDGFFTTGHYGFGVSPNQLNYHVINSDASHVFYQGGKNGDGIPLMIIKGNGNVGIGTTSPGQKLDVSGAIRTSSSLIGTDGYNQDMIAMGGGDANWTFGGYNSGSNYWMQSTYYDVGDNLRGFRILDRDSGVVVFATNKQNSYFQYGNVGIGTTAPSAKLHVAGTTNLTGNVNIGTTSSNANLDVQGNVTISGNIAAKYQDVAEWVPARHPIPAGTVVVLDTEQSNHVLPSTRAYDTRVAGVVSTSPAVILGEKGEGKVMVATTGRVRVKVDATLAPIRVGDLLVTSGKEGIAMRSQPLDLGGTPIHRPGTLIGKALEPLEKGMGEILVLLSLQ